jgi:tetratricopeptide (TPR) repeat protein
LVEGTPDEAIRFAEGALAGTPGDANARVSLVRGLLVRRDQARAEQELALLMKQYPNVAVVHTLDGSLRWLKRDLAGARRSYERALSLAPRSYEALAALATIDILEGKVPEARARVEARLATEPKSPELRMIAARIYASQKDFGRAESELRQAIQLDANTIGAYPMLAQVLLATGKLEAAREEFDQIARRNDRDVAAKTMAAMIVHSQNKIADAKKRYEEIVNDEPTAAVAANNLAWIYAEANENLDEALRLAQSAAIRLPDNADVQDTIGWIYYKQELPALAIPRFEKSVETAPDNASFHYHLALALSKSGYVPRARGAVQQALKLKPNYAEAQKLLASLQG